MNAKFVGSSQFGLQMAKFTVHSASLMCRDAHQCVLSQRMVSGNGASPGGENCMSRNELPAPGYTPGGTGASTVAGAFLSLSGWQGSCGYENGLHSAIPNQGAGVSST